MAHSEERLGEIERERACRGAGFVLEVARALGTARRRAAVFSQQLEQLLDELAMEGTKFEVRFASELPEAAWTAQGVDLGEWFVSPDPGEALRPLAHIVSGGELSRVMLAVALDGGDPRPSGPRRVAPDRETPGVMAERGVGAPVPPPRSGAAPGLIFDEVDAGIGGRVAMSSDGRFARWGPRFRPLHHASSADRGGGEHAFPDRETGGRRSDAHLGHPAASTTADG